ncbi:jg13010 [Pararge aegeria aegeria]|uniref:Jg13010 protein n=1 Tax=Pararge aegeria aegeria TaxID=348720 RepID=A0A8S4SFY1_9NEOP|nr:jg13010 [Pararge aegeria aegeria]
MDSMAEDYESRLGQASQPPRGDTPSKKYQNQIAQLMTDVAILEEKLSAERLARVRAEEEVQHLRTCIDERDEKSDEALEEKDVISLTDSDHSDSEDDPCNESLEPTFRKEDINRSRMIRQSIIADFNILNPISDINDRISDEGILENSSYSSKDLDKSNVSNVNDTYLTGEDSGTDRFNDSDRSDMDDNEIISTVKKATNLSRGTYFVDQVNDFNQTKVDHTKTQRPLSRETYCMPTTELLDTSMNNESRELGPIGSINHEGNVITKTQRPLSRETYCVPISEVRNTSENNELQQGNTINNEETEITKSQRSIIRETYCVPTSEVHNSSINDKLKEQMSTISNDAKEIIKIQRPLSRETYCMATTEVLYTSKNNKLPEQMAPIDNELSKKHSPSRETHCTSTYKVLDTSKKEELQEPNDKQRPLSRETYYVPTSKVLNISNDNKLPELSKIQKPHDTSTGLKDKDKVQDAVPQCLKVDNMIKVPNAIKVESDNHTRVHKILPDTYVKKILGSIKQSTESNESLAQFERLEMETNVIDSDKKRVTKEFFNIKHTKETRKYFDEDSLDKCGKTPATVIKKKDRKIYFDNPKEAEDQIQIKIKQEKKSFFESNEIESQKQTADTKFIKEIDNFRSPSIVRENVTNDFEPSMIKKLLGKGYSKQGENEIKVTSKAHDSIDIFEELESPRVDISIIAEIKKKDLESVRDSIEKIVISDKIVTTFDSTATIETKSKNTIDTDNKAIKTSKKEVIDANSIESTFEIVIAKSAAVENTEKEVTGANESHLINTPLETNDESQLQANNTKVNNTTVEFENIYKDVTVPRATEFDLLVSQESVDENNTNTENSESEDLKYNLRNKTKLEKPKTERKRRKNKVFDGEILLESVPKCESKSKPPRKNLRLRRQKNISDVDGDGKDKLKDIVNLQSEFSDVTMDIPAPLKTSEDIPSPEKVEDEENSPILGIQSCPAKSITRSRRKLFTPRAEPLEESLAGTGDSNDRIRVPRPSYHRPRARRKL